MLYGGPATPYRWGTNPDWTYNITNPAEYWSGQSTAGTLVLALNTLDVNATRQIVWSEVPSLTERGEAFEITDVWTGHSLGCVYGGIKKVVASHDTIAYLVGRKCSW
jgi:alpha-galactosidase